MCIKIEQRKKGEEFSDNDNVDYFDEYERIHSSLYQNGFLQHCFNGSLSTDDVGDDNQNVEIFNKSFEPEKNNTNTSSSQSSCSNHSERLNALPHYQPRWHQHLTHPSLALRNPMHPALIKAHLDSVNQEIAQLDSRIESVLMKQHHAAQAIAETERNATIYREPIDATTNSIDETKKSVIKTASATTAIENKFSQMNVSAAKMATAPRRLPLNDPPPIDSDTEHIYETIPEDSESEPIYCSPYKDDNETESGKVEEWLNISGHQNRSSNTRAMTRSTKSNSSAEDHENSSSAYNTGGSCNSNHQLTLELNDSPGSKDGSKTLVFCPAKHLQPQFPLADHKTSSVITKKEKMLSPAHQKHSVRIVANETQAEKPKEKRSSNSTGKTTTNIFPMTI